MTERKWYVYMLRCGDDSLYTGITDDVQRRLAVHKSGKGAKYTRGRGPLQLVRQEQYDTKSEALRRELEIKALSRQEKLMLLEQRIRKLLKLKLELMLLLLNK